MASSAAGQTTIVPVVEIKNISSQTIPLNVKKYLPSKIFNAQGGVQNLGPGITIIVEDNRVDLRQLNKLSTLKLITVTTFKKKIPVESDRGTGGSF